ncbi:MAG: signal recognition particle protein [Planctomycetes bacterium]|nr:signal recognition particle protein [Planctomycetota bacterium]
MFESISDRLKAALSVFSKRGRLTEQNIRDGMREIRKALLEADVQFDVVRAFIQEVTDKAVGEEVLQTVQPAQMIVKIVHDELTRLMGPASEGLAFAPTGPTVIMMVGLQGSGKTTTAGKLAGYVRRKGRAPLLVAADVQRPAAIDQLETLGRELDIPVYAERSGRPARICQRAVAEAEKTGRNVVILDTAGRLHIDEALMAELGDIRARITPQEILLVADAMTGQDAVVSAREFNERLDLSGVILTKMDGDARGGAALSIKRVTGKPIKFMGVGERLDRLEEFHPDRVAGRILGMGDIVTLVEKAQESQDQEEARAKAEKLLAGSFTLDDFLDQMQAMKRMGPLKDLMAMIPGMKELTQGEELDPAEFTRMEAIIRSMTPEERLRPDIIDHSRRRRIGRGSGNDARAVRDLVNQFGQARKLMKQLKSSGGLVGRMVAGKHEKRKLKQLKRARRMGIDPLRGRGFPFNP